MFQDHNATLLSIAASVADQLSTPEGPGALALMRRMGLLDLPPETAPASDAPPGAIGIWHPRREEGGVVYHRDPERQEEWHLWADRESFPAASGKKRVVLLGESVARGIFYDPHHNPAKVLEEMLNEAGVPGGVEVIDLARTSLGEGLLSELLRSCLQLRPAMIVLFAGNNWHRLPLQGPLQQLGAAALRTGGVPALKAATEAHIASLVETRVRRDLAALAQRLPVVLMIPEFNLRDWQPVETADVPFLAEEGALESWLEHREQGLAALEAGDFGSAEEHGKAMGALDGGTSPLSFLLQARGRRQAGDAEAERELLEQVRDADVWSPSPRTPRSLKIVQEALRRGAAAAGIPAVDLPRVFAEHLGGGIPDRRLFVDYCHLNGDGMATAMAATAAVAAPLLGGPEADAESLRAGASRPEGAVESEARFTAAVHNAHWGQGQEIVAFHCKKALEARPETAEAMNLFLELRGRRTPEWMAAAYERLEELGTVSLRRYVFRVQHGKLVDRVLLAAIGEALAEAGSSTPEAIEKARCQELGLGREGSLDLLDPVHRRYWVDPGWDFSDRRFFVARGPVSRFDFFAAEAGPAEASISLRLPEAPPGDVEIVVNGASLGHRGGEGQWSSYRLEVPALREGLNTLEVRWPRPVAADGRTKLREAADRLEAGHSYELQPTFGEIHDLKMRLTS